MAKRPKEKAKPQWRFGSSSKLFTESGSKNKYGKYKKSVHN